MDSIKKKRIDGRSNANVKKGGKIYHPRMLWNEEIEIFLKGLVLQFGKGNSLNMCCGASNVGDYRYDLDSETTRNGIGDIFRLKEIFRPNQFTVGIFDPPFHAYNPQSRLVRKNAKELGYTVLGSLAYDWQYQAIEICSVAAIFRKPAINLNPPHNPQTNQPYREEWLLYKDHRPSIGHFQIIWKV